MKQRRKNPYEIRIAQRSAPSFGRISRGAQRSVNRHPSRSVKRFSALQLTFSHGVHRKPPKFLDSYIAIWKYSCMAIDTHTDRLSLVFAALADPTRRGILARLASGDADVSELMKPFDLRQPTISKHLSVLERAGLVVRKRDAQRRPRTLVAVPLKDVADWIDPFRRFWEQKFASLDGYLKEMQKRDKTRGRNREDQ